MFTDLVFLGRFQPLHSEHLRVIRGALDAAEHVIIGLGSCNAPLSAKNPWTPEEREQMILGAVGNEKRITFIHTNDYPYDDDRWEAEIIKQVDNAVLNRLNGVGNLRLHGLNEAKVGLLCPRKDAATSAYLDHFKCWKHINVKIKSDMSATAIRNICLDADFDWNPYIKLPKPPQYVIDEHNYIKKSKEAWDNSPFPPMFITVDNVVIHRGKVLLVNRKGAVGKGLLALPGGFHEVGQTLYNSARRELLEETTLDLGDTFAGGPFVYDHPERSQLGTMVTNVFRTVLPDRMTVPKVVGRDDAAHAGWYNWSDLSPEMMHDDHYWILEDLFRAYSM
jgi:bifunctional NMN adenylyltransferase/nudix hydrolase